MVHIPLLCNVQGALDYADLSDILCRDEFGSGIG